MEEYGSTSTHSGSTAREFRHRRSDPPLPPGYDLITQKKRYCPRALLTKLHTKEEDVEHKFGYVFCHRGFYERALDIIDNSDAAVQNGLKNHLFLHEVDAIVLEELEKSIIAHDQVAKRVTPLPLRWKTYPLGEIVRTHLVTRRVKTALTKGGIETGTPKFGSSYMDTYEEVPGLLSGLWKSVIGHTGITAQIDLREEDFADALCFYSYHISRWEMGLSSVKHLYQTSIWKAFESAILKGYNVHFSSFKDLHEKIDQKSKALYRHNYFQLRHLHFFPPLIMVFFAKPLIDRAKNTKPIKSHWRWDGYQHIHHTIMEQVSSFTDIGDCGYNFILEIVHSGLGLGYDVETGKARNPLNGDILRDKDVIFESLVDRAMIDVSLELRRRNPKLRFSSCTRLPDVIIPTAKREQFEYLKAEYASARLVRWEEGEKGLSARLRAIHGGLYPQSHFVVADDPTAEIAARTWIDQKAGLDRSRLLRHSYNKWLSEAGEDVVAAVQRLNGVFLPNTVETFAEHDNAGSSDGATGYRDILRGCYVEPDSSPGPVPRMENVRSGVKRNKLGGSLLEIFSRRYDETCSYTPSVRKTRKISVRLPNLSCFFYGFPHTPMDPHIALLTEQGCRIDIHRDSQPGLWDPVCIQVAYSVAVAGQEMLLRALLITGFNINAAVGFHRSVLGGACVHGHRKIVDLLVNHGAALEPPGVHSPLELACKYDKEDIFADLLTEFERRNPNRTIPREFFRDSLYHACMAGNPRLVRRLLEHGVDVNKVSSRLRCGTALGAACYKDDLEIVDMLLAKGAHVNIAGRFGSPVYWACCQNHLGIAKRLLDGGAKIDFPLSEKFNLEMIKLLISARRDQLFISKDGPEQYHVGKTRTISLCGSPIRASLCSGRNSHERWERDLDLKDRRNQTREDPNRAPKCCCPICFLDDGIDSTGEPVRKATIDRRSTGL